MKIIKPGRSQRGWSKECTCTGEGNGGGGCGAVLLVEQPDLFITTNHCRDETEHFVTFKCVSCGVRTDIKNVPSNIVSEIRSKETDVFYNDHY